MLKKENSLHTDNFSHAFQYIGIFFLVVLGLLFFALVAGGKGEGKTITVDDDGEGDYTSIQDAIDNATDGDTIRVWDGVYKENIIVNRSLSLTGNGTKSTFVIGVCIEPTISMIANNSEISNFNISNDQDKRFGSAIFVNAMDCRIIGNSCWNTNKGIDVFYSNETIIQENDCISNYDVGIKLYYSNRNTILSNNCSDNRIGIKLFESHENRIINNSCQDNYPDFLDGIGIDLDTSSDNEISRNKCANNEFGGIIIDRSMNDVVSGNNCTENGYGIYIDDGKDSGHKIFNNSLMKNNWTGILMSSSSNVEIRNNKCEQNDYGIEFRHLCSGNSINNNSLSNNSIGYFMEGDSNTNSISNNYFGYNQNGMVIEHSNFNEFFSNYIQNNYDVGMKFHSSNNNSLIVNTIINNSVGILIEGRSKNNFGFANIFRDNFEGANASDNDGYEFDARLNYWGSDSGPFHPINNQNGMGDNISDHIKFNPWMELDGDSVFQSNDDRNDTKNDLLIPSIITGILSISLLGLALHREDFRFLLLSLLTVPLYTKMERSDILNQSTRNDIYTQVATKPGVNYSAIKSKLALGTSSLVYHLEVLEREGYIRSKKEMGRKMFFPRSTVTPSDPLSSILPPSPIQEKIIGYLKEKGQRTRKEIEEALSLKRQTVSYSIRNLERKGLVKTRGKGRNDLCEIIEYCTIKASFSKL